MLGHTRRTHARPSALLAGLMVAAGLLALPASVGPAHAADPCGTGGNRIACENTRPGTNPEVWDVQGSGDDTIQGFSTDISVNVGQRIDFKVDTDASAYTIDIYRVGYYQGKGARKVDSVSPSAPLPQQQPECLREAATELYDCGTWGVSASWEVPSTAVSGVHLAKLTRTDTGGASHITFVVREDASRSAVVFQTSDTSWQAYNTYGGSDFYQGGALGRAHKISYNRPVLTRDGPGGRDFFFSNEYPMVRFLEKNGYDTTYIAGVDTDRRGHLLTNHKVYLSVGHDEYWSGQQRANVEAARNAGVHLQFLAGNEMYWKTRYEPSADDSHTPYRTLVSYKETWANAKIDPSPEWTGTWRDPRFAAPARGAGRPENGLIGTAYMVNFSDLPMQVRAAEGKYRLWRHTTLATMTSGTATLAPHTIGYESNEDLDNGHRPPGLVRLSTTTGAVPEYLQDFGTRVAPGTTTHNLTLYKAPSGALVFSAGTVQWTWGLDGEHDSPYAPEPADRRMQQAQVNLFADMGVQPVTLDATLVKTTRSTDTNGPTVTITSPAAGTAQKNGDRVTLTGTAADWGGRVAGVEVSTDNGQTWRPATGTTSWTHSFIQHGRGSTAVRVRAIDDSANIGTPATRSFSVTCPCSIWGQTLPATPSTPDGSAVELGIRFTPTTDGFVTGIRFYKGTGNTGTHTGSLWSPAGQRLGQVTFSGETATGWQTATFATPVAVSAGQTYTASYSAPVGRYASQTYAFISRGHDANLLKVAGGFDAQPSGVYGTLGTLPTLSWQRTNYFVDVTFSTTEDAPLTVMGQSPAPDAVTVPVGTTVTARFSKAVTTGSARITLRDSVGSVVPGTTSYAASTRTVTFTPSAPLAHFVVFTATVTGTDAQGRGVESGGAWTFRTARPTNPPGVCPCSLFGEDTMPTLLEDSDATPVTLGTRFRAEATGVVSGIRFYKGPRNTGVHTGSLWSAAGAELATGTFTGETASGWQQLEFDTPVPISRGVTYTVSYRTQVGRYSATPNAFLAADLSQPPLQVTSQAGAYTYGTGFPSSSSSTSYLVDVIFERTPPSIALSSQQPAPGALGVPRSSKVRLEFSHPVAPGWTVSVRQGTTVLPGSAALDSAGTILTWTPAQSLPPGADVTVTMGGVVSTEGVSLPDQTWTFRTREAETSQQQTLFGDEVPETTSTEDAVAVELGTTFTPTRNGTVTAIRFFKGVGNGGVHTGSVWSSGGARLATVTFTGETATGWQTATLPDPLPVTAGTTYVVSYLAPQGRYARTAGFFAAPWTRGDLTAPADGNGRYSYGGGFPEYSSGGANYFADVIFAREAATLTVADRSPADGAGDASLSARPSLRVSAPLGDGWAFAVSAGGAPVAGTSELGADGRTVTFTPSAPLQPETDHTVSVTGLVSTEGATLPTQTWTFRTGPDDAGEVSLFRGTVPANPSTEDGSAIELGTAFTTSQAGTVTAIRFYKGAGNSGTHTGSVWSAAGVRLGTVTFTDETASGWQTATLATPVPVVPGQTYVVSYHAPQGHYASQPGFFATPTVSGPLTALSGDNGRYRYGAEGGFPESSWNSTHYFVDVVFRASS